MRPAPALFALVLALLAPPLAGSAASVDDIARGKYLVTYGGCNDCHTPHWLDSDGTVPVKSWLTGQAIGFRGPWGTVYPANVRLRFAQISEDQWLFEVRTLAGHPPMKWTDLRALSIGDQRAIYRFVRSLGKAGRAAPVAVPPEREPKTPYINVIPSQGGAR